MDSSVKKGLLRNLPKLALGSASLLAALYVGLSPRLSPGLYTGRLFRPYAFPEGTWDVLEVNGIARQDCYFSGPGSPQLHGWFFDKPGAKKTIMFSHGNTGNLTGRLNLVRLLLETGSSVFIYDYSGYGRSKGVPTIQGICKDGVVAFDYLIQERGLKPTDIVLYGESLGTAVSCEIAAERSCSGLVLQSGFSSLRKIGQETVPIMKIYPQVLFPKPFLNAVERVASRTGYPLLIIHGSKDQVVPFSHAEEVYAAASEPKRFVQLPDCAHSDIWCTSPETFVSELKEFIEELP